MKKDLSKKKTKKKAKKKGNKTCVEEKKEAIYEELLDFTKKEQNEICECTVPISKKKKSSVEKKKTKKNETISIKTVDEGFKLKRSVQYQQQVLNMVSIEELETLKLGVLYKTRFWNQLKYNKVFLNFSFFLVYFLLFF